MSILATSIRARLSKRSTYGIVLLIIFVIALALRVSLPYENVFSEGWVGFAGADPWYHMRLVENLVHHFPHMISFDPYALYPNGMSTIAAPFFDLLLGFVIWVIGLGNPSPHTIETVGAYFPAILGALVTVPVYFIGRELFNRNVGLLSASLIAILPGQFLMRSLLGFTDQHVAEVLFSTTAALFLILAIKRAKEKEISFLLIRSRDWENLKKPLIYALLAGLFLGIYLLSWIGGLLFVFIIFIYMIIQYIIDHHRGKSTDYLCIIGVPMFLLALIMVIPLSDVTHFGELVIPSLAIAVLSTPVLSGISKLMAYRDIKRAYYPLALVGLGLASLGIFYAVEPSLLSSMLERFDIFTPSVTKQTTGEVQPLLSLPGLFALFFYFTADIILALIALGLIIYAQIKEWSAAKIFLIIWCLVMLAAMLGQTRFAYYFAVNVALLAGYSCWRILGWSWSYFREAPPEGAKVKSKVANKIEMEIHAKSQPSSGYAGVTVVTIIIFLIAFVPNVVVAVDIAKDPVICNDAWHSSLVWMKGNTPDPFQDFEDPDFYYELYEKPSSGEGYNYPESAYGVMSWWDNGYWITRIAHRIPNANPSGSAGAENASLFFTAQDEASANEVLDKLGTKYVIADYEMANSKFHTMAIWAGESESQFMDTYYKETDDIEPESITLYYPEYYQSMCSRLYNFEGEAVVPHNSTWVISYEEKTVLGMHYREITSKESFATYEEAKDYLESHTAPNYKLVGDSPFISPVPLEKLEHYKLVHQSDPQVVEDVGELISFLKIFEYTP